MSGPTPECDPPSTIEYCTACEAEIDTRDWHAVTTDGIGDRLRILPFCSRHCRDDWRDDHAETDSVHH